MSSHRPSRLRRVPFALALLAGATLSGCGGGGPDRAAEPGEATGGTVFIALIGDPRTLMPPLVRSEHEQAIAEVVYDRLADIGPALDVMDERGFTPRLANAWQWADDSMSIAFTLDARARWHDGAPVVAEDVRRTFALYTDPRVLSGTAPLLANIDSVSVRDSATAVFWFKRRAPQQLYDAVHHLYVMPSHLLQDADPANLAASPLGRAPVGTGRFRFVRWSADGRIEVIADTANYRGRPSLDRVIYEVVPETGSAIVKLFTGESDFVAPLMVQNLEQATSTPSVRVHLYPSLRYQLMTFNLRVPGGTRAPHPILGDVRVRRALTHATNNERIVRAVFDTIGQPAIGPVPRRALPANAALRPLAFDTAAARALLDSAGWSTVGADGIRRKDGARLRLEVLVPGTSENRNRMAVLLQDQWRAVGAELVLQRLEVNALVERLEARRFDAVMNGWNLSPGLVGLRQVWTSLGIGVDGSNWAMYASPLVDANVDSTLLTFDPVVRDRTLLRAVQGIIDDAPAIWLVEDPFPAGMHARIDPGTLSPLGWWHGIAEWRIPADQRIDRDRIGLRAEP
jgi:peptide/nickel transport system substrate-binding protein